MNQPEIVSKKGIQPISAEVLQIEKLLKDAPVGHIVTYAEMDAVIHRPIQKHRNALYRARKRLRKEFRIVFHTVWNKGVKRAASKELAPAAKGRMQTVKRITRDEVKNLACAVFDELTDREKLEHCTEQSHYGIMLLFSESKSIRKIESQVFANNRKMSPNEAMALFKPVTTNTTT